MKAVFLCAGFGTRLRPLTDSIAKPLLPIAGKPLVERLVEQVAATGLCEEIVVVTNGRYRVQFDDWVARFGQRHPALPITLLDDGAQSNETRLGAVRDLALAVGARGLCGPLLVAAGDNLFRFDLARFLADHASQPRNLILSYREPDLERRRRSGIAELAADGRVLHFWEKPHEPPSEHCCPPVYLFEDDALAELGPFLAESRDADAPGSFLSWLAERRPLYAHEMKGRRLDVGDLASYRRAAAWLGEEP